MKSVIKKRQPKNIALNYFFHVVYRLLSILIPIITTPYVSGILGADGLGIYSYVSSYSTYFLCFGLLGFGYYGQRLIASHREDKKQVSKDFFELYSSQLTVAAVIIITFVIFAFFQPFGSRYQSCFFVEIITISSIAFNVNYFLEGHEEFGKITLRDLIIKLTSLVLIFVLVKKSSDVWIYTLILASATLLSNISVWPYVLKNIQRIDVRELKIFRHLPNCLLLFLPTIASKIYPLVDKTLIGLITTSDAQVGNYAKSQQIVDSCTGFIIALGVVVAPRNSFLFASGDKDGFLNNISKAFNFVWFLSIPLCLGLISISHNFIPWYLPGKNFTSAEGIMIILALTIILAGFRNVLGVQYFVSTGQDNKFTFSILSGVIINVALSIPLIFLIGNYGAAIASVFAEFIICLIMFFLFKKQQSIKLIFKGIWKYALAGILMFLICFPLSHSLKSSIINTFFIISIGFVTYIGFLLVLKETLLLSFLSILHNKFSKVLNFFQKERYKTIVYYFFVVLISLTALCYSPWLLKYNLNKYIYILWVLYAFIVFPIGMSKTRGILCFVGFCWLPFAIYVISLNGYLNRDTIVQNITKEIAIAGLLLTVGMLSYPLFNRKRNMALVFHSFYCACCLVGLSVFVTYFVGFQFSTKIYAFALKNSVAPLLMIAVCVPFVFIPKNTMVLAIESIGSVLVTILILMMKCRAVIIVIPVIIIYISFNKNIWKYIKYIVICSFLLFALLIFVVPPLYNLFINNILFANNDSSNIDTISSGRFSLIYLAIDIFKGSPLIGVTKYYVDFEPLEILTVFGIFGYILSIPSYLAPAFIIYKKHKTDYSLYMILVVIAILMYTNSLFEAYSPYGPGIRAYMLWIFVGIVYLLPEDIFSSSFTNVRFATCEI